MVLVRSFLFLLTVLNAHKLDNFEFWSNQLQIIINTPGNFTWTFYSQIIIYCSDVYFFCLVMPIHTLFPRFFDQLSTTVMTFF